MFLTDTGTVRDIWSSSSGLRRLDLLWRVCDGVAVLNLSRPLFGTLSHFIAVESGGVLGYNVYLDDEFGADVLNGLGVGLAINGTEFKSLHALLDGSDRPRPLVVGGRHTFRVNDLAGDFGTFTLFYWPNVGKRLEQRLVF